MKTQYCKFEGAAIVMGKFSKMLDEDTILRIQGSYDCDGERGGDWAMKIVAENIENVSSIFFGYDFRHRISPSQSQDSQIRDIVSLSNIFENLFSIFLDTIFVIQFPSIAIAGPSNSQYYTCVQHF